MTENFNPTIKDEKAFTFIELLVILAVSVILLLIALPAFRAFQRNSDAGFLAQEIINSLRLAQSKALASEGASQYGVYFDTSTLPHQYVLFKGKNYAARATSSDEIRRLPNLIEIYNLDLWGGKEIVFEKITGHVQATTSSFGEISLKSADGLVKTVYIENSGLAGLNAPSAFSDEGRIQDSRHVHFSYNREINTTTEKIVLKNFSTTVQEIPFSGNIKDGQFYWQGQVDIDGQGQILKIHTHSLNFPDTQFSVHRDRRYNDKALTIYIDGDASGSLLDFSADGQITRGTSVNLTIGADGDPQTQ